MFILSRNLKASNILNRWSEYFKKIGSYNILQKTLEDVATAFSSGNSIDKSSVYAVHELAACYVNQTGMNQVESSFLNSEVVTNRCDAVSIVKSLVSTSGYDKEFDVFELGRVHFSDNVISIFQGNYLVSEKLQNHLYSHASGYFGCISKVQFYSNFQSILNGGCVVSVFTVENIDFSIATYNVCNEKCYTAVALKGESTDDL